MSVSSRMRAASSWWRGDGFTAESAGGRGVFSGWGGVGVGVDEGLGLVEAEVEELTGGVETVAGLGVFELALHDVDQEADYQAAVFGLLADDFGEGGGCGFRVDPDFLVERTLVL